MIHNLGTKTTLGSLLPTLSRTANANGTGFDLQGSNDAEGDAVVILDCGAATAGTNPTYNVKLQDSADNSAFTPTLPTRLLRKSQALPRSKRSALTQTTFVVTSGL
jgi:hypothetical protein